MSVSGGDGQRILSRRGQSTVIGLVLLIGMVAAGSIGILLVAGDALSTAEQQSEQERIQGAFVDLSQTMATTSVDGDTTNSIEFDAGERGAITKSDAGTIVVKADGRTLTDLTMSAIEYEGDDGSIVAYQAGGVWREKGEKTQMLSQPGIEYDNESKTLSLPVTTFDGDQELTSGDVTITHNDTKPVTEVSYVENSTVILEIESEYYVGWKQYFEDEVGPHSIQDVEERGGNLGYVEVELGLRELEGVFSSGIVVSDSFEAQGGNESDYDFEEGTTSPAPIDDEIDGWVTASNTTENRSWADDPDQSWTIDSSESITDSGESLDNGTYFADGLYLDGGDELRFDLSDGNATLVVDGDIVVDGGELTVDNWENASGSDHSLNIYSTGNFEMGDSNNGQMCVETCPQNENDDVDASGFQVYGTSNMSIGIHGGTYEGVLFAPSDDFEGPNEVLGGTGDCTDEQACFHSNPEFYGSLVVESAHAHASAIEIVHDPQVKKIDPDIHPDGWVIPPDITYLNVAEHNLIVENS